MMNEARNTFYDLIVGIAIYAIIACIAAALLVDNNLTFIVGIIYGTIISGILSYHMFRSLEKTLDYDPTGAEKHARKMAAVRMVIMVIAVGAAILLSTIFNIIGVLIGMMALKISAYLQPIIRSYITFRIYKKGR